MKKIVVRAALVLVALPLLAGGLTGIAQADVSTGQSMKPSNYSCGSNERITGDLVFYGPVPTKQHAMIYRNCGKSSVKRRANVIADTDGRCITVGAGKAIVLHQEQALPSRTVYRSSKSC